MKLKQLSNHFTFWNKVCSTHLTDAGDNKEITEQVLNEIINRRGKSFISSIGEQEATMIPKLERRITVDYDDLVLNPIMDEAVRTCTDSLMAKRESLIAEVINRYCDDHSIELERLKPYFKVNTNAHDVVRYYIQQPNGKQVNLISFYPHYSEIDEHKKGTYYLTGFGKYEIHYTGAGNDR